MTSLMALYSFDSKESNLGKFLKMVVLADEKSAQKVFREVLKHRAFYGVRKDIKIDALRRAYKEKGADGISNLMEYGSVELIRLGEVLY